MSNDPQYSLVSAAGNGHPWQQLRVKKNAGPTDPLSQFERVQSELWEYYTRPEFPEIMGEGRHAVLTEWYHRAPFGQPRYVDINALRILGASPWVEMCMKVRINEIATLEWDIVPLEKERANDRNIADAYEFISHPNFNQESFSHVLKSFLRDVFWFDAGVVVKTFSGIFKEREFSVPPAYHGTLGETLTRSLPYPHNYVMKRHRGRLLKQLPVGGAKLEEFYARDGGSFAKDVDEYGITRGYWQYTFKYPAVAPIPFSDREIIYAMLNPISSSPYGRSPIENLGEILNTLVASTLWNYKFFEEGGIPEGILAVMNMSLEEFKVWRAYFTEEINGNPHKLPMINPGMGGDVKWVPFSPSQSDLEFLESQKWYLHLVASLFEVNMNELGFTDSVNRSSSEEQSQVFKRRAIAPLLGSIEWYMNLEIMQELHAMGMSGTLFKFIPSVDSFENARRTANFVSMIQSGLKTVNEIRVDELGMDEVEWGNEPPQFWKTPQTYDPWGDDPSSEDEEEPDAEDREDPKEDEREEENERDREEELTNTVNALVKAIEPMLDAKIQTIAQARQVGETMLLNATPEPQAEPDPIGDDAFYNLPNPSNIEKEDPRAATPGALERELERDLKEIFKTQESEIYEALGILEKGVGVDKIRDALNRLDTRHFKNLLDALRRFILRAMKRGGNKSHQELKITGEFSLKDEDAERFMQDYSAFLAISKFKQVRARIRKILVGGLEKGDSAYTIGKHLKKEFASMKGYEAKRIARTETMRAFNFGREKGYLRSGMIKAKQWLVAWDDRLCEQCRPMANQLVPLGKEFISESGGMVQNPPLHPNCRCTIVPILKPDVRRGEKGFYKVTKKMKGLEEAFECSIDALLRGSLQEHGSLNKVGEWLKQEGHNITVMSLSNWCRDIGVETAPKGGDQSQFWDKK